MTEIIDDDEIKIPSTLTDQRIELPRQRCGGGVSSIR